ncbi:potential mitochondrial protein [Pseudozyma hubeiensis SY62]|uniref:Potential mitochondrial protein n=1 Tax=Pseudozyma hubeiensis (strain SY62) TaxID=1305764 RepID=R9P2V9_PSEHS|nr:potential mitochondrial protein [Pseudozyma hubeiensis SY62]GAC95634.1 potential mitochondrial protein [Pseudozyma hubeiensis SY62]
MTTLSRTGAMGRAPTTARTTIDSVNRFKPLHTSAALYAPITPPPPPPPPSSSSSTPLTSSPPPPRSNVSSRPTKVNHKPLPSVPNTLPILLTSVILALLSWTGFTIYATNKEKLSSSIFKSVLTTVKTSPEISSLFSSSTPVVLKRETWLGGQPRVQGAVNMMQGRVDLAFQIHPQGEQDRTATVYFTSIRESKHSPFEIVRFVVVEDGTGKVVSLLESGGFRSIDVESGDIV